MKFSEEHVCWAYLPHVKKSLLPFDSLHSEIVKSGTASHCLESALYKSCLHQMQHSFDHQLGRLLAVGFNKLVVVAMAESLL